MDFFFFEAATPLSSSSWSDASSQLIASKVPSVGPGDWTHNLIYL